MIYIGLFFAFLIIGFPICFVIGLIPFTEMLFMGGIPAIIFPQRMIAGSTNYLLLSIPFFIFAGNLMNTGGITRRIIDFSKVFVGTIRGGLAMVNIIASMFFGGISGSSNADTAAIGSVLIPAMEKDGYDIEFSAGITVTSSTIGAIIPPSISMVMYAIITEISIGTLFVAGAIPGILIGVALIVITYFFARKRNYPKFDKRMTLKESVAAFKESFFALLMPLIILGGILGGVFTPTEAAGVSAVYAIIVGFFVYKELTVKKLMESALQSCKLSAIILMILAMSSILSWVLTLHKIPEIFTNFMLGVTNTKLVVLLILNVIMLLMGMVLGPATNLIILTPIFMEVARTYGIDLTHLGVIMVLNLTIGLITPPVGTCLYTASAIAKIPLERLLKNSGFIVPLVTVIVVLFLVTYIPGIHSFLPKLLGMY